MAEAPGATRKTTTYKDFEGMASENERYNVKPNEMFFLENIMRIAPHKLHSVPGPGFPTHFPLATICTDTTLRGQQSIKIETAFDQENSRPAGNKRTSWAYIHNGEVYTIEGTATCAGGNMTYVNTCIQINHFTNDNPTVAEILSLPIEAPFVPFINTRIGTGDQFAWGATTNAIGGLRVYYNLGANFVDYLTPSQNGGGHDASNYAFSGNEIWLFCPGHLDVGPAQVEFAVYDRALGTKLHDYATFGTDNVQVSNMQLTSGFLYCAGSLAGVKKIYKVDRTTGVIAASFDVTDIRPNFISVENDNLIYVLCSGTPASVYYISNFTDLVYVGKTTGPGFSPFGLGTGIFNNGTIYFGSNGFAGFNTDIEKIIIACPPNTGPVIASVSTGSTVAAGASINVTWADILIPDVTDKIQLAPAPAAGSLGFNGATATQQSTGGAGSGTMSFAIPGGTTPGSYIFQLVTENGSILIATSNTFTVT